MKKYVLFFILLSIVIVIFFLNKKVSQIEISGDHELNKPKKVNTTPLHDSSKNAHTTTMPLKKNEKQSSGNFSKDKKAISVENITRMRREDMVSHTFHATLPKIIKELDEIPECIEPAETKKEIANCYGRIGRLYTELSMALGIYEGDQNNSLEKLDLSRTSKNQMIKNAKEDQAAMQKLLSCIENINNDSDIESCFSKNNHTLR